MTNPLTPLFGPPAPPVWYAPTARSLTSQTVGALATPEGRLEGLGLTGDAGSAVPKSGQVS
jgi:hypothetical protein